MEITKIKKGKPYLFSDVAKWGGKGDNLLKLSEVFNVPAGFIISSDSSQDWINSSGLTNVVEKYLASSCTENDFQKLKRSFREAPLGSKDTKKIAQSLEGLVGPFAVRSSDVDEDGETNSFAGQRDTILGPENLKEVILAYKEVVASLFTPRSIKYMLKRDITPSRNIAVPIQRLIDAKVSGVAYSPSPKNQNEILIESTWGLCTSVVDGRPCDIYRVLDTVTGNVIEDISQKKMERDVFSKEKRKVTTESVPSALRSKSSLTQRQALEVAKTVKSIERAYGCPMDMEFAFDNESTLYVLQARPITTMQTQESNIILPNIPANRVLARSKNIRNQGIFEGPAVIVRRVDHVNKSFDIDGDLREMNKRYAKGGYILLTPEVPPQLEQYVTNARAMYATECGTTGHAAAVAAERGIVYLGRGANSVPNLLQSVRSGTRIGIAVNRDEGILYSA